MEFLIFAIISGAVLYRNRKDNLVREAFTYDPTKTEPGADETVNLEHCMTAIQSLPDGDLKDDIRYIVVSGLSSDPRKEARELADKIEKDHPFIAKCLRAWAARP